MGERKSKYLVAVGMFNRFKPGLYTLIAMALVIWVLKSNFFRDPNAPSVFRVSPTEYAQATMTAIARDAARGTPVAALATPIPRPRKPVVTVTMTEAQPRTDYKAIAISIALSLAVLFGSLFLVLKYVVKRKIKFVLGKAKVPESEPDTSAE